MGLCCGDDKMTPEQMEQTADKYEKWAPWVILSGFGTFGGLAGGLWNKMEGGAIGAAFGASSGQIFGGMGMYQYAKDLRKAAKEKRAAAGDGDVEVAAGSAVVPEAANANASD